MYNRLARTRRHRDDVRDLHRLAGRIGGELLDAVIVTTGDEAYRRQVRWSPPPSWAFSRRASPIPANL